LLPVEAYLDSTVKHVLGGNLWSNEKVTL